MDGARSSVAPILGQSEQVQRDEEGAAVVTQSLARGRMKRPPVQILVIGVYWTGDSGGGGLTFSIG